MIMLAVLDSYELTEFIKQDIPKPDDPDEAALWERVNARIRSHHPECDSVSSGAHQAFHECTGYMDTLGITLRSGIPHEESLFGSADEDVGSFQIAIDAGAHQQASKSSARGSKYGKADIVGRHGHHLVVSFADEVFQLLLVVDH